MSAATITEDTKTTPVLGTGYEGQTFLVGNEVYLRGIELADAKVGMSWRPTLFPAAPERTEEWIKDDLVKEDDSQTFAILRKADDRVVGSVKLHFGGMHHSLEAKVDPLYGARGLHWKGEAVALVVDWIVNERGQAVAALDLPADETPVIAAIEQLGMRQTARFREMYARDGARVDRVVYEPGLGRESRRSQRRAAGAHRHR
jgi:RimJ/RimL family protein N-acetyltransferase